MQDDPRHVGWCLLLAGSVVSGAPVLALSLPVEAAASAGDRGAALTVVVRRAG